jgi:hypothetical protein
LDNQAVNKHVETKKIVHKEVENKTRQSEDVEDIEEVKDKGKDEDSKEGDMVEGDIEVEMKALQVTQPYPI